MGNGFTSNLNGGGENVFSKPFWMCVIALIILLAANSIVDIDQSYAHGAVDGKITENSDNYVSEAHFYGVPTFNIEADKTGDFDQADKELETRRRQFWGISIQ